MEFLVRSYAPGDADALGEVFYRAVHVGAARAYSDAQCKAWVPSPPKGSDWEAKFAASDCVVAQGDGGIVGFVSRKNANFDMAYVLPEVMGQGVGGVLCAVLEGRARAEGIEQMNIEASLVAEPFFERRGWRLVHRQNVMRRGVTLQNCRMKKQLIARAHRLSA